MSETFAAVNGQRLTELRVTVGNVGPWTALCTFEAAPDVSGLVTLTVGSLTMVGTVEADQSGTFAIQRKARIVGGAGGWANQVKAKNYHNDAGVKALTVAQDAAREVGETIGGFVPTAERVGNDYVRAVGTASAVLETVVGGAPWWVDYAGVTQVGPRPAVPLDAINYHVLAYDPQSRLITLGVDDPGIVQIGSVLSDERLDAPQTVRDFELRVTAEELRIVAWCGGSESAPARLPGLLRSIIARATDDHLFGKFRYRVVRMASERVELQAIRKGAGLPDVLPVSMWPGVAGVHAELTPGAEVLVEFIEGDRTMPIVTHFAGKGGPGFVPVSLVLGGTTGPAAARLGDSVEVLLPPAVFSGTIVVSGTPSPATGVVSWVIPKAEGVITAGSGKVKIA